MSRELTMRDPDKVWPSEDMRAAMMIDAIAGLYTGPKSMDDVFAEIAVEREAAERERTTE